MSVTELRALRANLDKLTLERDALIATARPMLRRMEYLLEHCEIFDRCHNRCLGSLDAIDIAMASPPERQPSIEESILTLVAQLKKAGIGPFAPKLPTFTLRPAALSDE